MSLARKHGRYTTKTGLLTQTGRVREREADGGREEDAVWQCACLCLPHWPVYVVGKHGGM